jgi:hypothetical protein
MRLVFGLLLIVAAVYSFGQQERQTAVRRESPDAMLQAPKSGSSANLPDAPSHTARPHSANSPRPQSEQDSSLVLTSRAKSPVAPPFPLTSGQSLGLASPHTTDFSSLIFVGAGSANTSDARQGNSMPASGKTCLHASDNKTDGGSDWMTSLVALTSHGGRSYCALGEGGFWKRSSYAATRAMVAHRYNGMSSFDPSQILIPGAAPGFPSNSAYQYDAGQRLASRYGYAVGRDALRNIFSEFWPDVSTRVLRRHAEPTHSQPEAGHRD